MLINSKFRDYYDSCAAWGVDTTVHYNRLTKVLEYVPHTDRYSVPNKEMQQVFDACEGWGRRMSNGYDISAWDADRVKAKVVVLGFCGVLHRVVLETREGSSEHPGFSPRLIYVIHLDKSTMPPEWEGKYGDYRTNQTLFEDFDKPLSRENTEVFVTLGTPVFLANSETVILNPRLRDLGYQKYKDGVTAFQEISAFIAGALNTKDQMLHVADDKELIAAHGFDKHSFRKGKTK